MKRRIFATLLAFCLVASLCVVGAAAEDLPGAENNVITLDRSYSGHLTVKSGENIKLDLNGYTLTNSDNDHTIVVQAGGTLTVIDSSAEKTGKVDNINHGKAALVNNGTATLQGGTFDRSKEAGTLNPYGNGGNSYYTVANYGTMYIYDGVTIQQDGTSNGGTRGYYSSLIRNGGQNSTAEMTIYGGLFSGGLNTIKNDDYGVLTINSGTFTNIAQAAVLNWNEAEINGGDFTLNEGTGVSAVLNGYIDDTVDKGQLTITGGTFNGNGGDAVQTMDNGSNGIGTVEISGGTFDGDIWIRNVGTADSTVTISENAVINGNIVNANSNNTLLISDGAVVDGSISGSGTSTVVNATVTGTVTEDTVVVNSSVAGQPASDSVPDNVVAVIGGQHFESLEAAIAAAEDGNTIDLVADAAPTDIVRITKSVTISGNGHKIDMTPAGGDRGKTLEIGQKGSTNTVTLDGVILNISDTDKGDAIDVWSTLKIVDSQIDIRNVQSGLVLQGGIAAVVNVDNSSITMDKLHGNGSNGGTWNISNNSVISISNCVDHGLSTEVLKVEDSTVTISGAGEMAIFAGKLDVLGNSVINVTESGKELPKTGYAGLYNSPVQVKATDGAYLNVDDGAVINLYNNTGVNGANDTIYLPEGSTLTNDGTINATVVVPEESNMNVVTFIVDGKQYDVRVVNDGKSTVLPILKRSGYEFHGWRSGNRVFDGGETVTVYNNMTFTALWSMIEIPDTYAISVNSTANGEVDVSLNNASAGSVITITATPDEGYRVGAVTVSGPDGRVDVERVDATTYTFVMPAGGVEIDVSFVEDAALSEPFTDVSEGHWFYEYVAYVYTHGLMEGTSATTFEPDAGMTRAMFWAVLARIDGQSVSGANWLETARAWAMAEGVSDGTAASELVTREQMVTMLYRFAGSPVAGGMALSEFADAGSVSSWASDAMSWALGEGVISGMGGGMLSPQGTATRAQAAAILMRFVEG